MKTLSLAEWGIIFILALLTALEPISIDLYLPGFLSIAKALRVDAAVVQISLSTFLGGFAVGQLIWGPLADRYGRKKPILISLLIYIIASVGCAYVTSAEQLWVLRFIQAIGGCGGIVISRAIVSDYFEKDQTLKIFSLLAMIMGVAPIVAPLIGNLILQMSHHWEWLFGAMALIGAVLFLLTLFFLPETKKTSETVSLPTSQKGILGQYIEVLKVPKFVIYSLIAGVVNGALMIYISNGPFLIIEKGGFSGGIFSLIFAINAIGLAGGSFFINILSKYSTPEKLCKIMTLLLIAIGLVMLSLMYAGASIEVVLVAIFLYLFIIGTLFPLTTELVLSSFTDNSGSASSLFGAIQLTLAFIFTLLSGVLNNGTIAILGIQFVVCAIFAFALTLFKIKR